MEKTKNRKNNSNFIYMQIHKGVMSSVLLITNAGVIIITVKELTANNSHALISITLSKSEL